MSIKLVNINLSFSSQEDSQEVHHPIQINSQTYTDNSQLSELRFLRRPLVEKSPLDNPVSISKSYSNHKKIRFLKPVLSLLKIPRPLAPASQLGLFDFPDSGTPDKQIVKTVESLKPNRSCNQSILSFYNRSTVSLYQTERTPLAQNKINKKVLKRIRQLMKEIKLVRKRYYKKNVKSGEANCNVTDLTSEVDLQLPAHLSSRFQREL